MSRKAVSRVSKSEETKKKGPSFRIHWGEKKKTGKMLQNVFKKCLDAFRRVPFRF